LVKIGEILPYVTKEFWGKKKKKQRSNGKELIPNTHSREVIKLHLSLWHL
jgi:hypothetical protein